MLERCRAKSQVPAILPGKKAVRLLWNFALHCIFCKFRHAWYGTTFVRFVRGLWKSQPVDSAYHCDAYDTAFPSLRSSRTAFLHVCVSNSWCQISSDPCIPIASSPPSPPPQILGVSKCGTTDLYHRLSKHKDVIECAWKGPHFFVSAATCLVDEQLRPAFSRVLWCSSHATRHLKQLIQ